MEKFEGINNKISEMRQALQELIKQESNLLDPKIIAASQQLDDVLNEYNNMLKNANK